MSSSPGTIPNRSETELQQWQREGQLQVRSATAFRALAEEQGLEQAYRETHVVVASDAELTQQASLVLHLGPSDPPIRVRQVRFGPAEGHGGHGNTDLVIPMGSGGAPLISALLEGQRLPLSIGGTPQPAAAQGRAGDRTGISGDPLRPPAATPRHLRKRRRGRQQPGRTDADALGAGARAMDQRPLQL